jgi:uncharacterized membrane protein YoaK (UPF0700 family)
VAESPARRERERAWFAIWLAWVAAFVDAVGYLMLLRLGLSHMSGNTIQIGLAGGRNDWSMALAWLLPVPLFLAGILLALLTQAGTRRLGWRAANAAIFALEAALLLAFLLVAQALPRGGLANRASGGAGFFWLAALGAVAMGMQTATVHTVGGRQVRTTYITGLLTNFAEAAATLAGSIVAAARSRARARRFARAHRADPASAKAAGRATLDRDALRRVLLLGAVWLAFVVGALAGAYAEFRWAAVALVFPIGSLLCLAAIDLLWPSEPPPRDQAHERPW